MSVSFFFWVFSLAVCTISAQCHQNGVKEGGDADSGCCGVSTAELKRMTTLLKDLSDEIKDLKKALAGEDSCFNKTDTTDFLDNSNTTDPMEKSKPKKNAKSMTTPRTKVSTDFIDGVEIAAGYTPAPMTAPTTPSIPIRCPRGFSAVGGGCFRFFKDYSEWESFGDAVEVCQSLNSVLASPERAEMLRDYLKEKTIAKRFWMGAKRVKRTSWKWLDGKDFKDDDWDVNNPSRNGSKRCVYWRHPNYRGVNHYCGEKFAFICQVKTM